VTLCRVAWALMVLSVCLVVGSRGLESNAVRSHIDALGGGIAKVALYGVTWTLLVAESQK